jgi:hypothetical protein
MAACRELAENYNSQYDCLYRLRDDTNESSQIREEANALLVNQTRRDQLILATVLDLTFPIIGKPDSRRRIREELESLLASPNDAVRARACTALKRSSISEATVDCRAHEAPPN